MTTYGVYPPELCKIFKKKRYASQDDTDIVFDVVIELYRNGATDPHLIVFFECKNHARPVEVKDIRDFSDRINSVARHKSRGIVVSSSRLQAGAENMVRNRQIGLAKFDENGFDVVIERKKMGWVETGFVQQQLFEGTREAKPLKFSAYLDGRLYSSFQDVLRAMASGSHDHNRTEQCRSPLEIPYISEETIHSKVAELRQSIEYSGGEVDLDKICANQGITLTYSEKLEEDSDGNPILGMARFKSREIQVNLHENGYRQRFTVGHELGHFLLNHDRFLKSESVIEQDLFQSDTISAPQNYYRLEVQANIFASALLLPTKELVDFISDQKVRLEIKDRGHGFIFIDDNYWNYNPYNYLMKTVSQHFGVSIQAIEIRLKKLELLNDKRSTNFTHLPRHLN